MNLSKIALPAFGRQTSRFVNLSIFFLQNFAPSAQFVYFTKGEEIAGAMAPKLFI